MKLSAVIKKQAMPFWERKNILLEIEVVDFKELILKLHVEVNGIPVGNIFLENQGKRIFRANFEHKRLSAIKEFIDDERRDIEREFGYLLYKSYQFADPAITIKNEFIKLNLKSQKRITNFVKIIETNGDFKNDKENVKNLSDLEYFFNKKGLCFRMTPTMSYYIPYSDLLFHN